jgi:rare lipoprotein A
VRNDTAIEQRQFEKPLLSGLLLVSAFFLATWQIESSVANHKPHNVKASFYQMGVASWYGPGFHGRKTASGEVFNQNKMTAAHKTLPLGTRARVTDVDTGKSVQVTINDRGPYAKKRVIDLSKAAADQLGITRDGTTTVTIEANPPVKIASAK